MDSALAAMASQGIVLVAAAGNYGWNSANKPANHADVMAVAALADSDGRPGGLGPSTSAGPDDTYADFSNRGQIAAPGVDILSSWKGTGLKILSGTSMASPHVAGAAAMLIAQYPNAFAGGSDVPQDHLDTRLVRDVLLATALDNGTILSQYGVPVPVLRANGVWKTVPVVEITSQVNNPDLSPLASQFLEYVQAPEMAHTVAFAEGTFNPVAQMGNPDCFSRFSKEQLDAIQWDSLEEEMSRSVEYDIVPDYDKLLDIMSAAKREASGG